MNGGIFRARPLASMLAAAILVFSVTFLVPSMRYLPVLLACAFAALFGVIWLFFGRRKLGGRAVLSFLLAVLLLGASVICGGMIFRRGQRIAALADSDVHTVTGYIREVRSEQPYGSVYDLVLETVDGETFSGMAELSFPFGAGLAAYDTVSFSGTFAPNESEYDSYLRARGVTISVSAEDVTVTGTHRRDIYAVTARARTFISENFERLIGGEEAGFAAALLTGDREALDGQTRLAFRRLGISHLLAVSGLHLAVVIGGADFLLRTLTVSKRKKNVILLLLIALFTIICGLGASILRAALMLALFYLAELVGERSDGVTALFFAVALILAVRPHAVYDAGLWLSFLSTLGILTVTPFLPAFSSSKEENRGKRLAKKVARAVFSLVIVTLAATIFTMPVTYLLYGGTSLVSPLANLVFVPLVEIVLYLSALTATLFFVPGISTALGAVCRFFISATVLLAERVSDFEGIYLSLRYPFAGVVVVLLIVGTLAVLFSRKCSPSRIFAVFLACTVAFGGALAVFRATDEGTVRIFYQTDGISDAVGFVCDGKTVLIDIGSGGYAVPSAAADSFSQYYECEIDTLVLTHLHTYHAGTVKKLADKVKIHRLLLPEPADENESRYIEALLAALDGACEVAFYARDGEVLEVGVLQIELPQLRYLRRSAQPAIFFRVTAGEKTFAYVGSAALELPAVREAVADTDAVILGAHGPVMKNIFSADVLAGADAIIFVDSEAAFYTETERLTGEVLFAEDYCGFVRIAFRP